MQFALKDFIEKFGYPVSLNTLDGKFKRMENFPKKLTLFFQFLGELMLYTIILQLFLFTI